MLLSTTVPLFRHEDLTRPPYLVGSGVLVRIKDRIFLFTDAHVLEEFNDKAIIAGIDNQLIGLTGESYRTALPKSGTHQHDRVDAAILCITEENNTILQRYALDVKLLDFSEAGNKNDSYLLLGRPHKQARTRNKIVEAPPLLFINHEVAIKNYHLHEYPRETYLLMNWEKRWLSNTDIEKSRSLSGISGGGMWRLQLNENHMWDASLTAIFTDFNKPQSLLIGIRVLMHLRLIATYDDDLKVKLIEIFKENQHDNQKL